MTHSGRCHCGVISFAYDTRLPPQQWSVRSCQCAFCRAHGALSTSDPAGLLTFHASEPDKLNRYRFATRSADFLICRTCGVYVGATMESPHGRYGIININALETRPQDLTAPQAMSYAQENEGERTARREQRWTPLKSSQ
jgi:hypothetical protein